MAIVTKSLVNSSSTIKVEEMTNSPVSHNPSVSSSVISKVFNVLLSV